MRFSITYYLDSQLLSAGLNGNHIFLKSELMFYDILIESYLKRPQI